MIDLSCVLALTLQLNQPNSPTIKVIVIMRSRESTRIHILWTGPHTYEYIAERRDAGDFGLYQLYGPHLQYGPHVLLYIGQTVNFAKRHRSEGYNHPWYDNGSSLRFHLGRIWKSQDQETPTRDKLKRLVVVAERLLILAHSPAFNSDHVSGMGKSDWPEFESYHVLNWGQYGYLLPEVSSARHGWEVYDKISEDQLMCED